MHLFFSPSKSHHILSNPLCRRLHRFHRRYPSFPNFDFSPETSNSCLHRLSSPMKPENKSHGGGRGKRGDGKTRGGLASYYKPRSQFVLISLWKKNGLFGFKVCVGWNEMKLQ
ncbi:hypothetical protein ACP275_04G139300 [Erythranthe tilingii]